MRKRIVSILMASALALTMAGCKKAAEEPTAEEPAIVEEVEPETEVEAALETEEEATVPATEEAIANTEEKETVSEEEATTAEEEASLDEGDTDSAEETEVVAEDTATAIEAKAEEQAQVQQTEQTQTQEAKAENTGTQTAQVDNSQGSTSTYDPNNDPDNIGFVFEEVFDTTTEPSAEDRAEVDAYNAAGYTNEDINNNISEEARAEWEAEKAAREAELAACTHENWHWEEFPVVCGHPGETTTEMVCEFCGKVSDDGVTWW